MSLFIKIDKSKQYLYSAIIVLLVSGICFSASAILHYRVVALILLVTVSLIAVSFDIYPVLLAAALSALIWDLFFIPPRFTLHIDTAEDTMLLIMYFVIAMINGILTHKIRDAEKIARIKEERANSVKLYNTILNSLSHELRTPLATIIGAADNLQLNEHLTPSDREQLLGEISKAGLRLNQQVENLLNISRLESGHIQPKNDWCDIVELSYEVVKQVEERNPHRNISISIKQSLPLCLIDGGMLNQVLFNLLNNAVVHTSPGCKVWLSASCHANLLELVVEDEGAGFSEIDIDGVFSKFSRKDQKSAGSGLGLSIVKGFTEALNGTVSYTRGSSGGAKFTVSLPVQTSEMNQPA
jgi:two-component system, OmpR family, sensor histidine kinase KdpD